MSIQPQQLIGRREERALLQRLYDSPNAEFLAVYGRRRVGKTFLINQFFREKGVYFEITGSPNASTSDQLANFHDEYCGLFEQENLSAPPKDWREAFHLLAKKCASLSSAKRIVLFFDELPWLASHRSGFLDALDYFWNRHASRLPNLLLVVCGSAASWMITKVINNKGGLYGRLSAHMRLTPFSLAETEEYLLSRGIDLPRIQICEIYMAFGGIPKYLSYVRSGLSSTQVINEVCFAPQGPLLSEFHKLYLSLFDHSERHLEVIRTLASSRRAGITRAELIAKAKNLSEGGLLTQALRELEECGFIFLSQNFGKKIRERLYRLIDEYSLFYLQWIDPVKHQLLVSREKDHWTKQHKSPQWNVWAGKAFESLCFKHVVQMKHSLSIGGVSTYHSHWQYRPPKTGDHPQGAEIDLVIDRADNCINLCEMKFTHTPYTITKSYAADLERKSNTFRQVTKSRKALFTTIVTPYGVNDSQHVTHKTITLDSLFL